MRSPWLVVLVLVAAPLAAQQPRALQVRDLFALDYFMQYPFEEPKGWLDAGHYLVFDGSGRDGPKAWSAVEAATGQRREWLPRGPLEAALAPLLPAEAIAAGLDDADHYHWSKDCRRVLLNVGDDLFVAGRDGKVVRLTNTPAKEEGEQFSPDGLQVAFVSDFNVYVVPSAGGEVRAVTQGGNKDLFYGRLDWVYQEEVYGRGDWQGFWWSPDSQRLALLKLDEAPVKEFTIVGSEPARPPVEVTNFPLAGEDNPVTWLGVADVSGGEVRWFDTGKYPDQDRLIVRVTWTPDGKEVFFQVQNREQTWLDMLAGDAVTAAVRPVFHEGSDCWVEPGPEPEFVGGDDFLWLSERDGFRHVYRYGRDGVEKGRLTQGDWQVKKLAAVDEANGAVLFTADVDSPLTTQLYSVPLDGGEITAITKGRGTHEVDMAPGNATFLSTFSSTAMPHQIALFGRDGGVVREVATSKTQLMAPFQLPQPEFVQIPTRDGFPMEAWILKPVGYEAGRKYPVLQANYSGPHTPRVRDEWGSRDYLWYCQLAQQGFLVFACDNQSASGKGRKYSKACWRDLGRSELRDLEDGVKWLVDQGLADSKRVAIWGWSYGGYQTCFNLTHSRVWKCGIAVNPVTDWRNYDSIYTERYLGLPTTNQKGYDSSSAVAAAARLQGRLMLIAAAMDDNVHVQNSLQLLKALQENQKDCDFMIYPGVRHGIEDLQQQMHLFTRMTKFLKDNL